MIGDGALKPEWLTASDVIVSSKVSSARRAVRLITSVSRFPEQGTPKMGYAILFKYTSKYTADYPRFEMARSIRYESYNNIGQLVAICIIQTSVYNSPNALRMRGGCCEVDCYSKRTAAHRTGTMAMTFLRSLPVLTRSREPR